jgi:prophage antirepressor-like protein
MDELTQVFEGRQIRIIDQNGDPWFIAPDVCSALGLDQVTRAMDRLEDDEVRLVKVTHPQSAEKQIEVNAVCESGLYNLILRSDKPEAKRFRKWVTAEVLPAIRKRGGYLAPAVDFSDPNKVQLLLDAWKAAREKLLASEGRVARLVHNNRTYTTTEIAKELGFRSEWTGLGRDWLNGLYCLDARAE